LFIYGGRGNLITEVGRSVPCTFAARQVASGRVILHCQAFADALDITFGATGVQHFEGTSDEGIQIQATGLFELNRHAEWNADKEESWACTLVYSCTCLETTNDLAGKLPALIAYGLTNYTFHAGRGTLAGAVHEEAMSFELEIDGNCVQVLLKQVANYQDVERRLKSMKGIEVTCEAILEARTERDTEFLDKVLNGLCYVSSVARGSKVQWVYRRECDSQGTTLRAAHHNRVTKPYVGLALIDPRAGHAGENKIFTETAMKAYFSKRDAFRLDKGTIDLYLDAKQEQDYLETRAVKLTIAVEALKHAFLSVPDSKTTEYLIEAETWEGLVPLLHLAMREMLIAKGIPGLKADIMFSLINENKLRGLNRRGFSSILRKLLRYIGLRSARDLDLFVKCRNTLVHQGTFYTTIADPSEKELYPVLQSKAHEYRFILHFVDVIFLRLLDYHGPYIDWSRPEGPQTAQLR